MKSVVQVQGVTKVFGSGGTAVQALRGIDLSVAADELLMLVGPSGCGKTTLISVIAGILDYDEGRVEVLGQDLRGLSNGQRTAFRGKNLGFVFQQFNLIPALTAEENVSVPALLNGHSRKDALAKAAHLLEVVGLGDRRHSRPTQLSGGQQQRVAIARALVHDPRLVVCDEPTSALDHDTGAKVMELLRSVVASPGRALVIVTHDNRTYQFADRIAAMEDGRITRIVNDHRELESAHV